MIIDWNKYEFRCHTLGKITTGANIGLTEKQEELFAEYDKRYRGEGRPLTEKQQVTFHDLGKRKKEKPTLSTTVKSHLNKLWFEESFGKKTDIQSKYLDKGIIQEEVSISLYSRVIGKPFFKNKDRKGNGYISGEPDNTRGKIRDIKTSWDGDTFPFNEPNLPTKDYYWQVQGYMWLWGLTEAEVIYCLVNTPDELINDEKFKIARKTGYNDLPDFLEKEIENRMTFDDIPEAVRVQIYEIPFEEKAIETLKVQIGLCREYLIEMNKKYAEKLINYDKKVREQGENSTGTQVLSGPN